MDKPINFLIIIGLSCPMKYLKGEDDVSEFVVPIFIFCQLDEIHYNHSALYFNHPLFYYSDFRDQKKDYVVAKINTIHRNLKPDVSARPNHPIQLKQQSLFELSLFFTADVFISSFDFLLNITVNYINSINIVFS